MCVALMLTMSSCNIAEWRKASEVTAKIAALTLEYDELSDKIKEEGLTAENILLIQKKIDAILAELEKLQKEEE